MIKIIADHISALEPAGFLVIGFIGGFAIVMISWMMHDLRKFISKRLP